MSEVTTKCSGACASDSGRVGCAGLGSVLRNSVIRTGLATFYLSFGPGNLRASDWILARRAETNRDLCEAIDFFLLFKPLPTDRATNLCGGELIRALTQAGVMLREGDTLRFRGFRLLIWDGALYFAEAALSPISYFGADSLALSVHLSAVRGRTALDLCAGPGLQTLTMAMRGATVTAVEVSSDALVVAKINLEINDLHDRVMFVNSSAEDFLENNTARYDIIAMNPPLVPTPADFMFPLVGNGGEDGQQFTRLLIRNLDRVLRPGGQCLIVGLTPVHARGSAVMQSLTETRRARYLSNLLLLGRHSLTPGERFFESFVTSLMLYNKRSREDVEKAVADYVGRLGIVYLQQYVVTILDQEADPSNIGVKVIDQSTSGCRDWFY